MRKFLNTFGGEYEHEDICLNTYGIQIEDQTIFDLTAAEFSELACMMINHLIANGHKFGYISTPSEALVFKEI